MAQAKLTDVARNSTQGHKAAFDEPANQVSLYLLKALALQASLAVGNAALFHDLQSEPVDLARAYDAVLEVWVQALDQRTNEAKGHTKRVTDLTVRMAREMGVSEADLVNVRRGAMLHDVGNMSVPDRILLKPGALTDEEVKIMRRHPNYAYELLSPMTYLREAIDIPYCHHEKWDGTGYPRGLQGEEIPLGARIFAVADVWDALRSDRPFRPAWPADRAKLYIREQAYTHFDPKVVEVFVTLNLAPNGKAA